MVRGDASEPVVRRLRVDPAEEHPGLGLPPREIGAQDRHGVVAGDLGRRERLGAAAEAQLAAAGFALVDPSLPTYPAGAPSARIDHAAVDGLEVVGVEVVLLPVSDHRALVVEVR